jgi:hypothetical protein
MKDADGTERSSPNEDVDPRLGWDDVPALLNELHQMASRLLARWPGAAIQRAIAVQPRKPNYVRAYASSNCRGTGRVLSVRFKLSMLQQHAADGFEANDTALAATAMKPNRKIAANIMDEADTDWYRVVASASGKLELRLENRSSTLCPIVVLYNSNKSEQLRKHDDTPGANLVFHIDVEPGRDFYIRILAGPMHLYTSHGDYELLISERAHAGA